MIGAAAARPARAIAVRYLILPQEKGVKISKKDCRRKKREYGTVGRECQNDRYLLDQKS
jgi:hypothetical protein